MVKFGIVDWHGGSQLRTTDLARTVDAWTLLL